MVNIPEIDRWKWEADKLSNSLKLMSGSERLSYGPHPWNWWVEMRFWSMTLLPDTSACKWEADQWATTLKQMGWKRLSNSSPLWNWGVEVRDWSMTHLSETDGRKWEADQWPASLILNIFNYARMKIHVLATSANLQWTVKHCGQWHYWTLCQWLQLMHVSRKEIPGPIWNWE